MLGGNFVRIIPDHGQMKQAWRRMGMAANVITKLTCSKPVPGKISRILPVTGRMEIERTAADQHVISIKGTSACVHYSRGRRELPLPHLLSEVCLICELAKLTLDANPDVQ